MTASLLLPQLVTQKSEPEQSLTEKQRQESKFLAMAVPIAVKLINWQLRETGDNSLRFKRATLEKQGREQYSSVKHFFLLFASLASLAVR